MSVRKYLFWFYDKGIKTYKVTSSGKFELLKPSGQDTYMGHDLDKFLSWFQKSAAITEDEYIDFCFLSDKKIDSPLLEYHISNKSSWDKQEIQMFMDKYVHSDSYQIFYSENASFVSQNGNIFNPDTIKKLYMKCIPEFSVETEEKIDTGSEETSLVSRYFIDKLKELSEN